MNGKLPEKRLIQLKKGYRFAYYPLLCLMSFTILTLFTMAFQLSRFFYRMVRIKKFVMEGNLSSTLWDTLSYVIHHHDVMCCYGHGRAKSTVPSVLNDSGIIFPSMGNNSALIHIINTTKLALIIKIYVSLENRAQQSCIWCEMQHQLNSY